MDCLFCLDWCCSCIWGNFSSIILTIIGLLLGGAAAGGLGGAAAGGATGAAAGGLGGAAAGAIGGPVGAAAGGPVGAAAGGLSGASVGGLSGGIPGAVITALVGYIIKAIISPFTSICESLLHNLIWICGSPITIRAAYMDGCLVEFLKACLELIRHLMGG